MYLNIYTNNNNNNNNFQILNMKYNYVQRIDVENNSCYLLREQIKDTTLLYCYL